MTIAMPTDAQGVAIPCLGLRDNGAHSISASATSAKNSTAFQASADPLYGARVVSVYATVHIYMKFGDSDVTATSSDHFFPAGVYYDFKLPPELTHLAVLRVSSDGTVYVSEKA